MRERAVSGRWLVASLAGLLVLAVWSPQSSAQSTTHYVDNVKTCNNLVPCHTTIQGALAAAAAGDVIAIFAGVYKEAVTIDIQVKLQAQAALQPAVIAAPPGAGPAVTITASGVQLLNLVLQADSTAVLDSAASGTVLQNNVIRSMSPSAAAVSLAAASAVVRGNHVIAGGIAVGATTGVTIASNQVTNAGADGIALSGTQKSMVQTNVVRSAGGTGIALHGGVVGNTVQDNVVTDSGADGILVTGDGAPFGTNIIRRNTAIDSGSPCDINDTYTVPSTIAPDTWTSNRFLTKCGAATK